MSSEFSRDNLQLDEILAKYQQAIDEGELPDSEQLIREHPRHANELRQYFADNLRLEANRLTAPVNRPTSRPCRLRKRSSRELMLACSPLNH